MRILLVSIFLITLMGMIFIPNAFANTVPVQILAGVADNREMNFSPSEIEIKKGDTICILEAMKLFNEIESEISGTVAKICVQNGTPVEFGQDLFLVEVDG